MTDTQKAFWEAAENYLMQYSLGELRNYGRSVGVHRPTDKGKKLLISKILSIRIGELAPIKISKRGAPVKNTHVDERIIIRMAELYEEYFPPERDLVKEMQEAWENRPRLRFEDPDGKSGILSKSVYRGQVDCIDERPCVLPLDCAEQAPTVLLPKEIIEKKDLREGDRIVYQTRTDSTTGEISVAAVATVNDYYTDTPPVRPRFDESIATSPSSPLRIYKEGTSFPAAKFVDWLLPLFKGQRGCVVSAPKAGKTNLLLQLAKATAALNAEVEVFVLLIDQSPETVGEFYRNFDKEKLFYTTYEDDPKRQVLMAEFLLKRAKRMVEQGKDVCLFIDSLTALAHAFNDTEESSGGKTLSCGLEIKTVRYIKKYFGSARCLEKGGSLTILGAVSTQTGNPFDDVVRAEYTAQANYELRLDDGLALRRVYPAIDFALSSSNGNQISFTEQQEDFACFLYNEALPKLGGELLVKLLSKAKTYDEYVALVEKAYQD